MSVLSTFTNYYHGVRSQKNSVSLKTTTRVLSDFKTKKEGFMLRAKIVKLFYELL